MSLGLGAQPFRNPLVVALDVDGRDEALRLAEKLASVVGGFKVGPRLCLRGGSDFCREIARRAPLFMDNKHFDIPSTMEAAVRASFAAGASVVTVHALAGSDALRQMATLEKELNRERPFRILAVTILTSWSESSYPESLKDRPVAEHVASLADLSRDSGLAGIVCSPHELALLKTKGLYLLTPGIRFAEDHVQDQKRTADPRSALQAGASALVVGRPILQAKDPLEAAQRFLAECKAV